MSTDNMPYDFSGMSLAELRGRFPDERACIDYVVAVEHPGVHICQKCKWPMPKLYKVDGRKSFSCGHCGLHWPYQSGTIFHKSAIPLTTWFYAFWIYGNYPHTDVVTLRRILGLGGYETAWRITEIVKSRYNPNYRADRDDYRGIYRTTNGRYRTRTRVKGTVITHNYNTLREAQKAYLLLRGKA